MTDIAKHIASRGPAFAAELERHFLTTPDIRTDQEFIHFMRESWRMAHYAPEHSSDASDAMAWAVVLRCIEYEHRRLAEEPGKGFLSDRYHQEIFGPEQ